MCRNHTALYHWLKLADVPTSHWTIMLNVLYYQYQWQKRGGRETSCPFQQQPCSHLEPAWVLLLPPLGSISVDAASYIHKLIISVKQPQMHVFDPSSSWLLNINTIRGCDLCLSEEGINPSNIKRKLLFILCKNQTKTSFGVKQSHHIPFYRQRIWACKFMISSNHYSVETSFLETYSEVRVRVWNKKNMHW